jgi:hypothetical protein
LLQLNHRLNQIFEHLDAVPLPNLCMISYRPLWREICRVIEQGIADVDHLFILDVYRLPLVDIFGMMIFVWSTTGILERLSLSLLFVQEFGDFPLELPPVDHIHHDHQASKGS